jgi:signal peptidase II
MLLNEKKTLILLILVSVVLLDQSTKYLAETFINPTESLKILPVFHLVNVKNEGAAFGLFKNLGNEFFIVISIIAIGLIVALLIRGKDGFFSLSLILSGAVGNFIDRLLYGYVRDFIDLSIGRYHWPAFNIADSALTIGLLLMMLGTLFKRR